MKKTLMILLLLAFLTGCTPEDFGFEYTTGTGLNLTKSKYNRLEYGITYAEAQIIIGGKCKNYYSNDEEDWYVCIDDKSSDIKIVLHFENKKLSSKSSSGLN